ncbi:MAG: hypothetical protein HYW01_04735 [Deltaproteobacteria bacterium]|nr:hypothetical protein [Deltaproteobacteria bacterium]
MWPEDNHTFCILEHGDVHVSFYVDTDQREPDPAFTGQLYIGVEDVMGLHARIVDKVKIEWGPEVYHYGRREFAIRDCNGYILSFSEPTDEPPTCHED